MLVWSVDRQVVEEQAQRMVAARQGQLNRRLQY